MRTTRIAVLVLLLASPMARLRAQQNLFPQASAIGGVEARQYSFGSGFGVDFLRQVAFPVGVVVPVGKRFSFDIGSNYAITTVGLPASSGGNQSFSGFTDTQIRGSYTFGNDALVASVMMNLPTGQETTTLSNFSVASSASSNFLLFPVNTYGAGFSVTPGLAAATTAGEWNLGLAASVRVNAAYSPFSGSSVRYKPGVETRIRGGVDRLLGSSRFTLGLTFSTFSNDQLSGGGFTSGAYDPGNRLLVDVGLLAPAGSGTIGFYVWNYYRSSSGSADTAAGAAGARENVFTGGVNGTFPISPTVSFEPVVEARIWSPKFGAGSLFGAGTAFRFRLNERLSLIPAGRFDLGRIRAPSAPTSSSVTGWELSGLARYAF